MEEDTCCEGNCGCGYGIKILAINHKAPNFRADAFHEEQVKKVSLSDYRGKWVILFFYPKDFTFVCPTELADMQEKYNKFKELGAEILSVSTDTAKFTKLGMTLLKK